MLHFWRRNEGQQAGDRATVCELSCGARHLYHAADSSQRAGEVFLRRGCWTWTYLGEGRIVGIDGKPVREFPYEHTKLPRVRK